jgi:hypothetical protein
VKEKTVFCVGCSGRRKFKGGLALGTANTKNGLLSADLKLVVANLINLTLTKYYAKFSIYGRK